MGKVTTSDQLKKLEETILANSVKLASKSASEIITTRRGYSLKRAKGIPKKIEPHNVDD